MRFFNTEGPVRPDDHYAIQSLDRMDIDELLALIRAKRYFVLHAPRQTGKTSALIALRDLLNSGEVGNFRCVNVGVGQVARDDTARGIRAILGSLSENAQELGDDYPGSVWQDILASMGPESALNVLLARWSRAGPTPLVLLVDEIDSLVGDTLLSVLRQLRAGYEKRPGGFPQSVVLCGVRDIRDYRIRSSTGEVIAGGSPFNVAAKSLRMGDFTEAETRALMAQHMEETGQRFSSSALDSVWTQTRGQPWLVNALCAGACFDNKAGRDRSRAIEVDDIYAAREELILSRRTHLDQLAHKLEEERVRRVVEPLLSGGGARYQARDLEYVRDLGLLAPDSPPRMANPIYREVVPRELGYVLQDSLDVQAAWYVDGDGGLNMDKLLTAFGTFFGEHSEHWLGRFGEYPEAGPQLILQAYLQRVVNGGGRIEREYGLGRGRTDLLVLWPREAGQPSELWERFVVECKVLRDSDRKSLAWTVERGVEQTLGYMKKCGAEGRASGGDRPPYRRGGAPGRWGRDGWKRTPAGRARGGGLDVVAPGSRIGPTGSGHGGPNTEFLTLPPAAHLAHEAAHHPLVGLAQLPVPEPAKRPGNEFVARAALQGLDLDWLGAGEERADLGHGPYSVGLKHHEHLLMMPRSGPLQAHLTLESPVPLQAHVSLEKARRSAHSRFSDTLPIVPPRQGGIGAGGCP